MPGNSEQLLLLLGKLEGDMVEGQKQRSRLFQLLEGVSKTVSHLAGRFEERCRSDDEWREEMSSRMAEMERAQADLAQRVAAIQPPPELPRRRTLSLSLLTFVGGSGGVAALFFGSGLSSLFSRALDLLKKIPH